MFLIENKFKGKSMKNKYAKFIENLLKEDYKLTKSGLPSVSDQKKILELKLKELGISDFEIAEIIASKLKPNDKSLYISIKSSIYNLKSNNKTLSHDVFNVITSLTKNDTKYLNEGECPESGCVKKVGDSWRIISNKTGKLWDAHYKTKEDADKALAAFWIGKKQI